MITAHVGSDSGSEQIMPSVRIPAVSVPERVHEEEHILLYQDCGHSEITIGSDTWSIRAGEAVWCPVGMPHSLEVGENSALLPVVFRVNEVATTLKEPIRVVVDSSTRLLIVAIWQSGPSVIVPDADLISQLFSRIERAPQLEGADPFPLADPARKVAEDLAANPGDRRSVEELAGSAFCSVRRLQRSFLSQTGFTLTEWRTRRRIELALTLLRSGNTVESVAHRVGYENASSFSRVYKKYYGFSPRDSSRID